MPRSLYSLLAQRHGHLADPISRRAMLQATAAGAAALLLSRPSLARPNQKVPGGAGDAQRRRVVVVGAGFAGLACAHELRAAGYDVTVIEARGRVGGRVLSFGDFIPERNVEGGGELIGSNHPFWGAYARQFGLEFIDVTESEAHAPIILDGKALDHDASDRLWQELSAAVTKMNQLATTINADAPWESPDAATLDQRSVQWWIDALDASPLCKRGLQVQFGADNAIEPSKQSLLALLAAIAGAGGQRYWEESEVYRCKGGNQQLATKLAEAIGADRVVLKSAVTAIAEKGEGMLVTCADGRTLEADDVVLAVPPSTWSRITISPALPATLTPQMGTAVKYLAKLKRPFWRDSGKAPDSLTDTMVSMTWEGTDAQPGGGAVCLTAFSGGKAAEECRTRAADTAAGGATAAYTKALSAIYPGFAEVFDEGRFMDWPSDPWTKAGYSFPAPGQVTTIGPLLRKGRGRLHFAGEHCTPAFVGYMEGALASGATLARRIAARDGAGALAPAR